MAISRNICLVRPYACIENGLVSMSHAAIIAYREQRCDMMFLLPNVEFHRFNAVVLSLLRLSFMMNRLMLRFDRVGTLDLCPLVLKQSGCTWPAVYIYE